MRNFPSWKRVVTSVLRPDGRMDRLVKAPFFSRLKEYINSGLSGNLFNLGFSLHYSSKSNLSWFIKNPLLIEELKVMISVLH